MGGRFVSRFLVAERAPGVANRYRLEIGPIVRIDGALCRHDEAADQEDLGLTAVAAIRRDLVISRYVTSQGAELPEI